MEGRRITAYTSFRGVAGNGREGGEEGGGEEEEGEEGKHLELRGCVGPQGTEEGSFFQSERLM